MPNIDKDCTKVAELKQEGQDLVQMYQAGFLDGVSQMKAFKSIKEIQKLKWKEIMKACKKAFEFRFVKRLQPKLKLTKQTGGI